MNRSLSITIPTFGVVLALAGCTAATPEPPPDLTRDEARAMQGKSDHGLDLCEWLGWYGDGICDEFCLYPDPDCDAECRVDSDCPQIVCITSPCPQMICDAGECVFDDSGPCDFGERLCPGCNGDADAFCMPDDSRPCPLPACPPPPPGPCGPGQRECPGCNGDTFCAAQGGPCPLPFCPPPPEPTSCGGIAGLTCPEGMFCDYADDSCGVADQLGTCADIPDAWIEIYAPVCGCDGVTYGNQGEAHGNGVDVLHEGACEEPPPPPGGCSSDDDCGEGYWCTWCWTGPAGIPEGALC